MCCFVPEDVYKRQEQGIIKYLNGKTEFMHRGFFDSVDIVFMVHTSLDPPGTMGVHKGCNGCVVKKAVFKGVSAHAGYSPHLGINALYAATQAINAINSLDVYKRQVLYPTIILDGETIEQDGIYLDATARTLARDLGVAGY